MEDKFPEITVQDHMAVSGFNEYEVTSPTEKLFEKLLLSVGFNSSKSSI